MTRLIAECSDPLSIFWLKKEGFLNGYKHGGGIKWIHKSSGSENSIGFTVRTIEEEKSVILQYTHTNTLTKKKDTIHLKVRLTTTPCYFGGIRYWFVCPLTKDGIFCNRRIGVLYSIDKWFGCRHCANVAYLAQFDGENYRFGSISIPKVKEAFDEAKTKLYKGKITRKYKRYVRLKERLNANYKRAMSKFDNIF